MELPLVAWALVGPDGALMLRSAPEQAALAGPAGRSRNLTVAAPC